MVDARSKSIRGKCGAPGRERLALRRTLARAPAVTMA